MIKISKGASLLALNTFGMDVRAKELISFDTFEEAAEVAANVGLEKRIVLGGGSNMLFIGDFDGVVINPQIGGIEVTDENDEYVTLAAGAGVVWDELVRHCVERDWRGVENLSGIPGKVGASPVQNIGAYGVEAKDTIQLVEAVEIGSGKKMSISAAECRFGYRDSIFKHELAGRVIITRVHYRLSKRGDFRLDYGSLRETVSRMGNVTAQNIREAVMATRNTKLPDPSVMGNAGSFFKNPEVESAKAAELKRLYPTMPTYEAADGRVKIPAGWMIEQTGWKGKSLGHAAVHDKQALVLINLGGATGADIERLSDTVRRDVKNKFGIDITPEVNFIR